MQQPEDRGTFAAEERAGEGQRAFAGRDQLVKCYASVRGLGLELVDFVRDQQLEGSLRMFGDVLGDRVPPGAGELKQGLSAFSRSPDRIPIVIQFPLLSVIQLPARDLVVAEAAFVGQVFRIRDRYSKAIFLLCDDLATGRAGAGIDHFTGQWVFCLAHHHRRLPARPELGRGMGHDRHPPGRR